MYFVTRHQQVRFYTQKFLISNGPYPYHSIYFFIGKIGERASNRGSPRIRAFTVGSAAGPRDFGAWAPPPSCAHACAGIRARPAGRAAGAGLGRRVEPLDGSVEFAGDRGPGPGTVVAARLRAGPGSRPDFAYDPVPGSGLR